MQIPEGEGNWLVGEVDWRPVCLESSEKERGSREGEEGEGGREGDRNHTWPCRRRGGIWI